MSRFGDVFILACGESVLDLTDREREHIAGSECVLALNKFALFYELAGILPTHVYHVDHHMPGPLVVQAMHNLLVTNGITDVTLILGPWYRENCMVARWDRYLRKRMARWALRSEFPLIKTLRAITYEYLNMAPWLEPGHWARRPSEPHFHYRTSMETAINYVAIRFPGRPIKLVGADLNSPRYFFQDKLETLSFDWRDWSLSVAREAEAVHFAVTDYKGGTILDEMAFIHERLAETDNSLKCCNPTSVFVTGGHVDCASVIS